MATHTRLDPATDRLHGAKREPSISDLLKELRDEGTDLFRQEIRLAKQEMSEKAARVGRDLGYLTAGAVAAHAGAVILLLAISALLYAGFVALGMSHMLAGWLAPLIVGSVVAGIGYSLVKKGQQKLSEESAVPERSMQSLEEDAQWAKEKVRT